MSSVDFTESRTEQIGDDQKIALLEKQLEQAQRLAAVGELTSTTTHEFNNLLMTIMNYAKMGLRHKDEPTRDKALSKILDASNRAAKVANVVLGLARNRSDSPEPTNLKGVIEDSMMLLERELRKYRVAVDLQLDEVPDAICCGNEIQRVLLNLITNARQAIGESGTIRVRLRAAVDGNAVVLSIRDSGPGISQEQLPQIFEPFFSTKSGPDETGKGGTGLGLAACKDIIDRSNGRIRVDSSLGKGTEFHVQLPTGKKAA